MPLRIALMAECSCWFSSWGWLRDPLRLRAVCQVFRRLERRVGRSWLYANEQHDGRPRHDTIMSPWREWSRSRIHNVLGRLPCRIDPSLPARQGGLRHGWQLEVQRFPVRVEHQVQPERQSTRTRPDGAGDAV